MTAENRVWVASILSAILLVSYMQILGRQVEHSRQTSGSQAPLGGLTQQNAALTRPADPSSQFLVDSSEESLWLESARLRLEIGKTSAFVHAIVLKDAKDMETGKPLIFVTKYPLIATGSNGDETKWDFIEQADRHAVWRRSLSNGVRQTLRLNLDESSPTLTIELRASNATTEAKAVPLRTIASWGRSDKLLGRQNQLEVVLLTEKERPWQRAYLRYFSWVTNPMTVPRGTSMVTLSDRYFCQSIQAGQGSGRVTLIPVADHGATALVSIESSVVIKPGEEAVYPISVYAGPRDFFRLRDAGFSKAFSLGFLARVGLILMLLLKWLASITHSYGASIILLSSVITFFLSPFTLISFRSMKKMQELQPKLTQIKKKYQNDSQRMNQETFALFREHRVSPLSGCLPMLLQLPIFFAIWSGISHVIELRGERFLWIKDLSLPDRLARLPFGVDLNLLPIIMAIAMFVQSRMSQQRIPSTDQSDVTKMLSGPLMSIMFGVMFYQFPASLVLYWLTNSIGSMVFYKLAST